MAIGISLGGPLAFGRRWWPAYLLIASAVLLGLLLAPDAYAAFGLLFDLAAIVVLGALLVRLRSPRPRLKEPGAHPAGSPARV